MGLQMEKGTYGTRCTPLREDYGVIEKSVETLRMFLICADSKANPPFITWRRCKTRLCNYPELAIVAKLSIETGKRSPLRSGIHGPSLVQHILKLIVRLG
jgi:hypothetical protein